MDEIQSLHTFPTCSAGKISAGRAGREAERKRHRFDLTYLCLKEDDEVEESLLMVREGGRPAAWEKND